MDKIKYSSEDLEDHDAIGAIIKDNQGRILMQKHVKYGFWTIPIGKVKFGQPVDEALKQELLEECGISIIDFKEITQKEYVYNRNGKKVRLINHIYEILKYSGNIENKEPHKHIQQEFKELKEIKSISHLSDATLMYLDSLGYTRPSHI